MRQSCQTFETNYSRGVKSYRYAAGLSLSVGLLVVGLLGCKPKTITATGQIFIVTRSAENVKLGAVEILLVEKSQVVEFLQRRQPAIESAMATRRQAFADAQEDARKAQAAFDWFLANGISTTNADYLKVSAEIDEVNQQRKALLRQFDTVESQRAATAARGNSARSDALLSQENLIIEKQDQKAAEATRLLAKLFEITSLHKEQETNKLLAAKSRVLIAKAELDNSPTAEDYFMDFSPVVSRKTVSDADGRFSFTYPHDKQCTIFASARREVLSKIEKYYWLVDAPANAETAQIFLSNNNLVFVDPHGYFKLKPKQYLH